ncbi:MAG TPA: thermonuclease family protein [Patescibacteria group bacterium]
MAEGEKAKITQMTNDNISGGAGSRFGFVYLEDGTFVNEELMKQDYAFAHHYPPGVSKSTIFQSAETQARENKLGLWRGKCTITKLKGSREQTNPVK